MSVYFQTMRFLTWLRPTKRYQTRSSRRSLKAIFRTWKSLKVCQLSRKSRFWKLSSLLSCTNNSLWFLPFQLYHTCQGSACQGFLWLNLTQRKMFIKQLSTIFGAPLGEVTKSLIKLIATSRWKRSLLSTLIQRWCWSWLKRRSIYTLASTNLSTSVVLLRCWTEFEMMWVMSSFGSRLENGRAQSALDGSKSRIYLIRSSFILRTL